MAVPIKSVPKTKPSAAEVLAELELGRVRHAEAILDAYQLIQALHDSGVLDTCRGALDAGDTIVTKLAMASNTKEAIDSVRNLVSMGRILSTVDPDFLHRLADELTTYARARKQKIGVWGAARMLFGKEGRRALIGTTAFVRAFGRALAAPR